MVTKIAFFTSKRLVRYQCDITPEFLLITRLADDVKTPVGRPVLFRFDDMAAGEHRDLDVSLTQIGAVRAAINRCRALHMQFKTVQLPSGATRVTRVADADRAGPAPTGRVLLYPFDKLEVGKSFTVAAPANVNAIRRLASHNWRKWGRRFTVADKGPDGCVVTRVAADGDISTAPARGTAPVIRFEDEPLIDIEEQNRLAKEVLAAAAKLQEDEF